MSPPKKTKVYIGVCNGDWPGTVFVLHNGTEYKLPHHVKHSPDGFSWGYGGSGPSELAKDMLWDFLGYEPEPALYQTFKMIFIATLDQRAGFTIYGEKIRHWLEEHGR